jgi:hypothetical protein
MWSVRLFVTGLLRNMARNETGDLIDSAFLDPDSGTIDWQSDMLVSAT